MGKDVTTKKPSQELVARVRSEAFKQQVALALPPGMNPDRFVRATVTALLQNPEVATAEPESVFRSVLRSAQDGLLPDGREAAIVVFRNKEKQISEAAYLPMVGGLRKVAAKHNITLLAYVVYAADEFEYELGEQPSVRHRPPALGVDRGEPIGAYAVATVLDSLERYIEVMSRAEIDQVRGVSRAKDRGPWVDWWPEMARKTVARRLFKQLPLGDLDERSDRIVRQADADVELEPVWDEDEQAVLEAASVPRVDPDPETGNRTESEASASPAATEASGTQFAIPEKARSSK